jgi:NAD(P)-dependent dehydrogenase (short-subunit alcohol dehydrogenase family)
MSDPLRLYGLKALVTNAGSGIGEAVSRTLVKHGAKVLAVDDANSGVEQQFKSVKGVTGHTESYLDVGRLPALIKAAVDKLGGVDILVTDFEIPTDGLIDSDGDGFEKLIGIRSELLLAFTRAVLPHIKKSPAGRIVNIGFLRSVFSAAAVAACNKAEKNLADITRTLAADVGEFGITANYVQPGAIMTPASREVFRKNKDLRDHCISNSAARRLGEPVDVAKVVLFLASDDATFVSGTGIAVDGGRNDN